MYSLLLKKVIPFALTFVIGSLVGGLFKFFVPGGQTTIRARSFYHGHGESRSGCDHERRRYLVAESKPLQITFKPDARRPRELRWMKREDLPPVSVSITFRADGKVQVGHRPTELLVNSSENWPEVMLWDAAAEAARGIQFEPEMVNGLPVTVTREAEIRFMDE
jgi:hypothetical protein